MTHLYTIQNCYCKMALYQIENQVQKDGQHGQWHLTELWWRILLHSKHGVQLSFHFYSDFKILHFKMD